MEKRVVLAVVLSFVVLYLYQATFAPKTPRRAAPPAAEQPAGSTAAESPGQPAAPPQGGAQAAGPAAAAPIVAAVADTEEHDAIIETDTLRAVFSNRGGVLKSWRLKTYKDKAGRPVDLVPQTLPDDPKPFSIKTGDAGADARANAALFRTEGGAPRRDPQSGAFLVRFEYAEAGGVAVRKAFSVDPRAFTVDAVVEASIGGSPVNVSVVMGPGPGDVETSESNRFRMGARANLYREGKVERYDAAALDRQPLMEGVMRWAGVDDHYFLSAVLARTRNVRVEYAPRRTQDAQGKTQHTFVGYTVNLPGQAIDATFFLGPKAFALLKSLDAELVRAIDYGMFAWLVVPLLNALNWVNSYVGNYGWSIIALTFLINLALLPLRHKSVVSMKKMQALQPEIKAIQERYGKLKAADPARQKMNQELMELYKQRGVNPASGCVPMLLTMPILFAFYSMLAYSIELRGAPFILWIKDLAAHDPYYVAPVLTGLSMLVQQRMTPQTGADPMQQKMFMIMPVVFTVMFLWAPSGLNIYWLFNNVLAIAQQYFTNRLLGPARVPRPAAERRSAKKGTRSA
ncbi:MAG TPA: membrane protein insertase YidC [Vicinamibacterales bacterium]|nr:membrane protein insertase YidC [Vicinamibacterales bacterium]HPK70654.1 membrane protein insertase YidC [Vicinamibacterales bacterium]